LLCPYGVHKDPLSAKSAAIRIDLDDDGNVVGLY
jgi:hypothetical protein